MFPLQFVVVLWISFLIDMVLVDISFYRYGIHPRTVEGLIGIVLSPFVHANLFHIISNTGPLFVLLSITVLFYGKNVFGIVTIIITLSGTLVWLFGRPVYHIGASGLVYGLAGYLIVFGIYKRKVIPLVVSVFVALTYGVSMITGLLPIFPGVSWEGHLFGAVAGLVTARVMRE